MVTNTSFPFMEDPPSVLIVPRVLCRSHLRDPATPTEVDGGFLSPQLSSIILIHFLLWFIPIGNVAQELHS